MPALIARSPVKRREDPGRISRPPPPTEMDISAEQRRKEWEWQRAMVERTKRRALEESLDDGNTPRAAPAHGTQKRPSPVVMSFSSNDWNRGETPALAVPAAEEGPPLELRGISNGYEGSASLLDSLLYHGLPGLTVRDIRALAQTSKALRTQMEDDEVWRLLCAALAKSAGLYAPASAPSWRSLFMETLWPARGKWLGDEATEATGFRIRVAARLRPRKHASNRDGLVLPLHQRLRLLKKGQRLGSLEEEKGGSSQEMLAEALKDQGELSPELLQALLEAQQLDAVMGQAESQARGGPKGGKSLELDEGSGAHAAAAAADAASEPLMLTSADKEAVKDAEERSKDEQKKKDAAEAASEEIGLEQKVTGSKLLLVQPSRVVMFIPGSGVRPFLFSTVCDETCSQADVYGRVALDAVVSSLNGMNACVLAYGQTGSGKTHTVFGPSGTIEACAERAEVAAARAIRQPSAEGLASATSLPESAGLVLRACDELLSCASRPGATCDALSLSAQYVQIYDETLIDLLSGGPVQLREMGEYGTGPHANAPVLQGAVHVQLESLNDALTLLRAGELHKRVAATAMNEASSRAHTVFLVSITQRGRRPASDSSDEDGEERLITSQLALVDLAGCEQIKQSKVVGQRLKEAVGINSSLLVLGKCITALSEGRRHVPYQEAKLTKLLRGAFGGSSRTTCVIAASPDDAHAENTVQALRFGERCATITNSARVAAVSSSQALAVVDEALRTCEESMRSLEAKNRTNLPAYGALKARHASLQMRRTALAA